MDGLRDHLSSLLSDALVSQGLTLDPLVERYVVDIMVSHVDADMLSKRGMPILAWCLRDAVNSMGRARFNAFKRLGDTALFLAGFFTDYVRGSGGLTYYIDMGGNAYRQASGVVGGHPVLSELSSKFTPVVSVLNAVSCQSNLSVASVEQLFEMYESDPTAGTWKRLMKMMAAPVSGIARG
jgi:hypothetical protein